MSRAPLSTHQKGTEGEMRAAAYLLERGWTVLERNYRTRAGEIDLIAEKGDLVAFIEVKAWAVLPASELEHAIDRRKQARIIRAARVYLSRRPGGLEMRCRFDVLFVGRDPGTLRHIENAFRGGID